MLTFRKWYFLLATVLLTTEILIALFLNDRIIRPFIGDFLVVILLYTFVRSFFTIGILPAAIVILLFSFFIKAIQYFHLIKKLQLDHSLLARAVMGTSFSWMDLLMYFLGVIFILFVERKILRKKLFP
jgi:hypothetical protein